jgi:arylsulfatase A-like enzyme
MAKNILFIMYDQLRFDYLSCAGHPHLDTPNFDKVASMGVRFSRTYVQSPICGSSRMSFYTGRYVHSHGAQNNNYPLRVGEMTLGDHLRNSGMDCWLIGKTHMSVDVEGMKRLGIEENSFIGARVSECGFDIFERDDGLWAEGPDGMYDEKRSPYNAYLKSKGYEAENPWQDFANAGVDTDGQIASGWFMKNAEKPANIREEDSETPWLTSRAIDFIEEHGDEKWCAHVSYIKPHWPYIVPKPYHNMYSHNQIQPVVRSEAERQDPHPVFEQFMNGQIGKAFQSDDTRNAVIPAYMGLIKQCDDQLGRLLDYLEETDRMSDTMIILTSDHGDYLGDHWMGEKCLFHDCSAKVPMIIYDPSALADETRGTVCDEIVESIDLTATIIDAAGGLVPDHIVEGKSLTAILHGTHKGPWREFAISEYDYGASKIAANLDVQPRNARLFMVADKDWKFMHDEGTGKASLFDLNADPDELIDIANKARSGEVLDMMYQRLGQWARRMSQRSTVSESEINEMRGGSGRKGILLGLYDGSEVEPELTSILRGSVKQNYTAE